MQKSILGILFALIISLTTSLSFADETCSLKFPKTNVCVNIEWTYGPYLDQYNTAKISYSENSQITAIKVIPWMVMMGHEHGSRPVVLTKTGDRDYLIEKAYFMGGMQGTWYLKIQLLDTNNTLIEEARSVVEFK